MTDTADQLAAAIRQLINDSVEAALRAGPQTAPPPSEPNPADRWQPARHLHSLKELQQKLGVSRNRLPAASRWTSAQREDWPSPARDIGAAGERTWRS